MQVRCPVCQSAQTRYSLSWKSACSIYCCLSCRAFFSYPIPSDAELLQFYQGFLYRKPDPCTLREVVEKKKTEIAKLFSLDGSETGTFLDHGGGTGATYQAAEELGFDVFFHEVDEAAIESVKTMFGLPEDHVCRNKQDLHGAKFRFILSDNVLEHVGSPLEVVRSLYNLLEEDGLLVLKTPHARTGDLFFYPIILSGYIRSALRHNPVRRAIVAIFRDRFWTCDPPRHLFAFSEQSLTEIAQQVTEKSGSYAIKYYQIPLFEHSLTKRFLAVPKSVGGILRRVAFAPLLVAEWIFKFLQVCARKIGLVSPAGLILFLRK